MFLDLGGRRKRWKGEIKREPEGEGRETEIELRMLLLRT